MWQRDKSEEEEKNFLIRVNRISVLYKNVSKYRFDRVDCNK